MNVIETDRLILRHLTADDAAFILALVNDPSWLQFIGDNGVRTLEDACNYIVHGPVAMYARVGFGLYLTVLKEDSTPIGIYCVTEELIHEFPERATTHHLVHLPSFQHDTSLLLAHGLRLPGQIVCRLIGVRGLLAAHEARADGPDERDRAEAYQQMRCLDQPVQITHQDHLLRDAKNRQNERVDHADEAQPSQPAGESRHDGQNQQGEGHQQTKEHMDAGEVHVSIRPHAKRQGDHPADTGNDLNKTCDRHKKSFRSTSLLVVTSLIVREKRDGSEPRAQIPQAKSSP